jgi:hypothetical protein
MTLSERVKTVIVNPAFLLLIYVLFAIIASIQAVNNPVGPAPNGVVYTDYNNYVIFKYSFSHIVNGKPLYILYHQEYWDLYKYSPAFALFFGLFAWLPDVIGLSLWNILNAVVLYISIRRLKLSENSKAVILWLCLIELMTSMQNAQSNGLMAGLMILALASMERRKIIGATLWLVIATFIKVYAAAAFIIFLFYPQKLRFIGYAALWTVLFAIVPLVVLTPVQLADQYHGWMVMMSEDRTISYGLSVMGWLDSWFGLGNLKTFVTIAGIILFFVPLIHFRNYKDTAYQLLFLAHILIWVIIFNHKAESPTFIIAVAGAGLWYVTAPQAIWRTVIIWLVFLVTVLGHTDAYPPTLRQSIVYPYVLKVVPCIICWIAVMYDLLLFPAKRLKYR